MNTTQRPWWFVVTPKRSALLWCTHKTHWEYFHWYVLTRSPVFIRPAMNTMTCEVPHIRTVLTSFGINNNMAVGRTHRNPVHEVSINVASSRSGQKCGQFTKWAEMWPVHEVGRNVDSSWSGQKCGQFMKWAEMWTVHEVGRNVASSRSEHKCGQFTKWAEMWTVYEVGRNVVSSRSGQKCGQFTKW
jgi:hypothetical protein